MNNGNISEELKLEIQEMVLKLVDQHARPANEILLDDVDLRSLLKVSRRTALEYRKKGVFRFYKLENKIYYILSEVISGIKEKGGGHYE